MNVASHLSHSLEKMTPTPQPPPPTNNHPPSFLTSTKLLSPASSLSHGFGYSHITLDHTSNPTSRAEEEREFLRRGEVISKWCNLGFHPAPPVVNLWGLIQMGRCLWHVMSAISLFASLVWTMKSRKGARSACAVALPMMVFLLLKFLYFKFMDSFFCTWVSCFVFHTCFILSNSGILLLNIENLG